MTALHGATDFDMVWEPVFSPDSGKIATKAELNGKYLIVVDGKIGRQVYDELWDPVFSPDGEHILVRGITGGPILSESGAGK